MKSDPKPAGYTKPQISSRNKSTLNSPQSAYLFTGSDEFRKELSLERLKQKLLGGRCDAFNYEIYYGSQNQAEGILQSLDTAPLYGARKLVVLKDPELLSEKDRPGLISYLRRPQKSKAVLVLLSKATGRGKDEFITAILRYVKRVDFPRLRPNEITSWIVKEFKLRGKAVSYQCAELIREAAQEDLGRAISIIEQISIFAGAREQISLDDIAKFTGVASEVSAFRLLDSINDKDTSSSLRMLKSILRSESNPARIMGLLGWHITRLIEVKRLLLNRVSRTEMASYLKAGSYNVNKLILQAGSFTLKELKRSLDTLFEADLMLKSSGLKGEFLLEMLVVRLST